MSRFEIDIIACRSRQQRLLAEMQRQQLDCVVVTQTEHVQYLSGPRFAWYHQAAAVLDHQGRLTLVAPNQAPAVAAADDIVTYEAQWHSTLRNDQREACCQALYRSAWRGRSSTRIGVEYSTAGPHVTGLFSDANLIDIEPTLYRLRRRKDADELARIRQAIAATGRMYERARESIVPGVTEIEIFNQLQAAAVEFLGEPLTGTGNDYQCGSPGGPPRQGRCAAAGELYILDLGPAFRGYFADNCRTFAVTQADERQQEAWSFIQRAFAHVEQAVRPGKQARELFQEVQAILDAAPLGRFTHHLGHGIGLFPHETPHLNPHWDDRFEVGDVFTAEPGLYAPELRAGMRIENDYLVTETGVECLSPFPMQLDR